MTIRIFGGASFPGKIGTFSASWPLAVLVATDSGVNVDLRLRFLKRLFGRFVRSGSSSVWWTACWGDIDSVDFGRRSIVLHSKNQRGCRFVTLTRRRLLSVVQEFERRQIQVTPMATTLKWFIKPT